MTSNFIKMLFLKYQIFTDVLRLMAEAAKSESEIFTLSQEERQLQI